MQFIAVLNKELEKPGLALNALAQMSLGLGHRLTGVPSISVYFGDSNFVREFRQLAKNSVEKATPNSAIYRDFPKNMEGGNMVELWEKIATTFERDNIYCAACYLSSSIPNQMLDLLRGAQQLTNYVPYDSRDEVIISELQSAHNRCEEGTLKTTTVLSKSAPLADIVNSLVIVNLQVGKNVNYDDLNLLNFGSEDYNLTYISANSHPIVSVDPKKLPIIVNNARNNLELTSNSQVDKQNTLAVMCVVGPRKDVESVVPKKETRAYSKAFDDLVPAIVGHLELIAHAKGEASIFSRASTPVLFQKERALKETIEKEGVLEENIEEDNSLTI